MRTRIWIYILISWVMLHFHHAWATAYVSAAAGNWNTTTNWTPNGTPGLGDTVTINHAITQNVANLVIGVNGAAPVTSYLKTIAGGGGTGYTSCSASISGGTAIRGGGVGCYVTPAGAVTPYIYDRGVYSACPTITVAGTGGTGATLPGTLTCATAGGTAAIKIGANGLLTVAANTYVRGTLLVDSAYNDSNNAFVLSPGVTLYMDMTQAAGAMYRIEGTNQFWRLMTSDCTSSPCSVQGYGGTTSVESASVSYGLCVTFKNTLFKNVGDAYTYGIYTQSTGSNPTWWPNDLENNVFDTGGTVIFGAASGGAGITFTGNTFQNTPVRYQGDTLATNVFIAYGTANSGGVRLFQNNVMDQGVQDPANNVLGLKDYTVTGNVFSGGLRLFASTGANPALFQHNFWRLYAPAGWANYGFASIASSIDDVYMFLDSANGVNPHQITGLLAGNAITNFIGGFSGHNTGDSGEWTPPTSVSNSLFLCDAYGVGSSEIASTQGTGGTYLHNTRCGGFGTFGTLQINETSVTPAGSITYKSNLTFETAQGGGQSLQLDNVAASMPGTQDVCTVTNATTSNCDYNGGYKIGLTQPICSGCTNQGRGYAGLWSFTPGYHDVIGQNPAFADPTRKIENWDRKYLGKVLSPQWASGTAYNYGDLVSNSDASVYQGEVFNFRCTNPAGCSGAPGPGSADTAWRVNWEWASLYWLRSAVSAKTTYTDAAIGCVACGPVQALNAWVRAGFTPQNPAHWCSGADGEAMGAKAFCAAGKALLGARSF